MGLFRLEKDEITNDVGSEILSQTAYIYELFINNSLIILTSRPDSPNSDRIRATISLLGFLLRPESPFTISTKGVVYSPSRLPSQSSVKRTQTPHENF